MSEPQAYVNGQFAPASQARLSVADAGFVQGTTIAEQMRTFGGQLFQLDRHIERLFRSLAIVEVDPAHSPQQLAAIAKELVAHNHPLLATGDDLGLSMFVTPGMYSAMISGPSPPPTVVMHTFPIKFSSWADKYRTGESLATTDVEQVSTRCWPPELKCRSRMHYFLADKAANRRFPGSRALMLDEEGCVVEATTANVLIYRQDVGLVLPPAKKILPGISMAVLLELADRQRIAHAERDITPADVATADEVFLTSTSPCILPVTQFNGQPIGQSPATRGRPGPIFTKLIADWSQLVGIDIVGQAVQFAKRTEQRG